MTDFGAHLRPGYRNLDPIAHAWMRGIMGGLVVAVILSVVAYSDYRTVPQLPLATTPTSVFEPQPVLPGMPVPPEAPKL